MFCLEQLDRTEQEFFFEISLPQTKRIKNTSLWQIAFKGREMITYFLDKPPSLEEQILSRWAFSLIIPLDVPSKKIRRYTLETWNSLEERGFCVLDSKEYAFLFKTKITESTESQTRPETLQTSTLKLGLWKGSDPFEGATIQSLLRKFQETEEEKVEVFFISGRECNIELMRSYLEECVKLNMFFSDSLHGIIMGDSTKAYVTFDAEGTPCAILKQC